MHVLARQGIEIATDDLNDTMVMGFLLDPTAEKGLKASALRELGIKPIDFNTVSDIPSDVKKEFGYKATKKVPLSLALIDDVAKYATDDAANTMKLYEEYLPRLQKTHIDVYTKVYQPLLRCLFDVEERGVVLDLDYHAKLKERIDTDKDALLSTLYRIAGVQINLASRDQMQALLFGLVKAGYKPPIPKKNGECAINLYDLQDASFGLTPLKETNSGAASVDADTMNKLAQIKPRTERQKQGVEFCKAYVKYAKLEKLSGTYVEGIIHNLYDDGRIHANFNICGAVTGRFSSASPNLQNLPRVDEDNPDGDPYNIRALFVAEKGKSIIAGDYANLEVRVLAHLSEEPNLLDMFAAGQDLHGATAVNTFNLDCDPNEVKKKYPHLRQAAKPVRFGLSYGMGANSLAAQLEDLGFDLTAPEYTERYGVKKNKIVNGRKVTIAQQVAQCIIDAYNEGYPAVAEYTRKTLRDAKRLGYVKTLLGRRIYVPHINDERDHKMRSYEERVCKNAPIQGGAADITNSAMVRIHTDEDLRKLKCYIIMQIHDELAFICPTKNADKAKERISWLMSHPFGDNVKLKLDFPVACDSGHSYSDAK
jgi:DNA polymerase-1